MVSLLGARQQGTNLSLPQTLNLGEASAFLTSLDDATEILNEGLRRFPRSEQLADQKATVQVLAARYEDAYTPSNLSSRSMPATRPASTQPRRFTSAP